MFQYKTTNQTDLQKTEKRTKKFVLHPPHILDRIIDRVIDDALLPKMLYKTES